MTRWIFKTFATVAALSVLLVVAVAPASARGGTAPVGARCTGAIQITGADPSGNPTNAVYGGDCGGNLGIKGMQGAIAVTGAASSSVCGSAGGFAAQHSDTLTSADGSRLFVRVLENACQDGPGAYHCIGTFTVTGGTERFAAANGSGGFDGQVSFKPDGSGSFQATYVGQLTGL
jgi:hypothetical protein